MCTPIETIEDRVLNNPQCNLVVQVGTESTTLATSSTISCTGTCHVIHHIVNACFDESDDIL